jgi:mannose-6-phosphate isomerase-like protein (cupin superfamily)
MKAILSSIPGQEGIRTVLPNEGVPFDLGPVHFKRKVRGEDSAYSYAIFELAPGRGVDLHGHPSPETFYVLDGEITFFRIVNSEQTAKVCRAGTTVMIPQTPCTPFSTTAQQFAASSTFRPCLINTFSIL